MAQLCELLGDYQRSVQLDLDGANAFHFMYMRYLQESYLP